MYVAIDIIMFNDSDNSIVDPVGSEGAPSRQWETAVPFNAARVSLVTMT